jgi:hypothetical protein
LKEKSVTGFLNSPIANSSAPDANPAARTGGNVHVHQVTRTVTTHTIHEVVVECAVRPEVDDLEISPFSGRTTKGLIFKIHRAEPGGRCQSVVVTLDDAEAVAENIMALVRQERLRILNGEQGQ